MDSTTHGPRTHVPGRLFIGLMSGTSMDGADGVLVRLDGPRPEVLASASLPMPAALRDELFALNHAGANELGYTLQLNAPALLAELAGIDVVADFRSRDV
ncbi:anhydro-N-acetylmuramic acid kinase, partial [Bordetella pertussis]|uniref:anhydro-N-acetylmuramic acid kinase n=1 Tax=Bordetella pertussis TaxID=520 RepID=UPI000A7FB502